MWWLISPIYLVTHIGKTLTERAERRTAQAMAHTLAMQAEQSLPSARADKLG